MPALLPNVAAPVTATVEPNVAAPVTAIVEPNVAAPVTPRVPAAERFLASQSVVDVPASVLLQYEFKSVLRA